MYGLSRMYYEMPDGTIKQVNPFTGTEVWTVPGRSKKPITNRPPATATKIERREPENYCNFCKANYLNVPPEKSRVIFRNGRYETVNAINTRDYFNTVAEFRRVPNLFEIVTMDYWRLNHGYKLSDANQEWKDRVLSSAEGREHVRRVLELKMRLSGKTEAEIAAVSDQDVYSLADAFFGGGHELVIGRRHYRDDAEYSSDLCSSGGLTPQEHYEYLRFTTAALLDIHANNRYVRYVSVFQNWLAPAGASFDHLHKQLVAIDEWGASVEEEVELARKNPNIYNELVVNFAAYSNLVFAENEHAIALADIGHRYPTLAVYSKSANLRPWELTDAELWGFSTLVHACHAAMGSQIACNEEWYYAPRDALVRIPLHLLIKWRTNNPAGFEGGTKIYINPISPTDLRDMVVPRLYELRDKGQIGGFKLAEECPCEPNSLRYYLAKS
jgi:galactose-1-phosphate uridylyltransferase